MLKEALLRRLPPDSEKKNQTEWRSASSGTKPEVQIFLVLQDSPFGGKDFCSTFH